MFVAVWPPAEVRRMLAALERDERVGIRWTTPAEWHVTLAFLGDVDPGQVASALAELAQPPATARFEAKVGRLGRDALVVPVA
ncbi:MAG: 2'-5' RNA ligase family protein, partial [Ilumatobacteraceae bacterium]